MSDPQLLEPIIEGGIYSTNFFNGRRLAAEDLDREKKANRQHERLLGQAIGEGVVYGLEVGLPGGQAADGKTLEIQKGLAINRNGDALYLPETIRLSLVPPSDKEPILKADFTDCKKVTPIEYPGNNGVYVVLIRPATDLSGSVPMSSIPDDGSIIGCGKSELVEGVQFKVVKMDFTGPAFGGLYEGTKKKLMEVSAKTDDKSVSMFRNIVAHACFGTEEIKKIIEDPFSGADFSNYGAIDKLRSLDEGSKYKITELDVPLSILRWTQEKIQFVDMWSVRCKGHCTESMKTWPALINQRRLAESKAIFFQFQEQILNLINKRLSFNGAAAIRAVDYFQFLPPLGILPIQQSNYLGIDTDNFFNPQPHRTIEFISGDIIIQLMSESMGYLPIDTSEKQMVWLYFTWQSQYNITKKNKGRPFVLFTTAHMPYMGLPRFDVSRWDFARYNGRYPVKTNDR